MLDEYFQSWYLECAELVKQQTDLTNSEQEFILFTMESRISKVLEKNIGSHIEERNSIQSLREKVEKSKPDLLKLVEKDADAIRGLKEAEQELEEQELQELRELQELLEPGSQGFKIKYLHEFLEPLHPKKSQMEFNNLKISDLPMSSPLSATARAMSTTPISRGHPFPTPQQAVKKTGAGKKNQVQDTTLHTPTKGGKVSDTPKNISTQKKTINKGIKVRIYPTPQQRELLNKTFGSCRLLHNKMLEERNQVYAALKEDKEQLYAHKYKTEKQYKEEYPFLKEVDSKALQSETRNLLQAFQNFFEGLKKGRKVGYPKFKAKKGKQTYTTFNINNNIRINQTTKRIRLPKVGWVKYRDSGDMNHVIKHVTVSKTRTDKYFVAIAIEIEIDVEPITTISLPKIEAFDMSAANFLVSEQSKLSNPRFFHTQERKLARLHRRLSRKRKGSRNREKARVRLAKFYEKIQNRKMDWTHKLTHSLSNQFDAIILEDLNIEGMKQFNRGLAKSITLDFSWHQFTTYLQYKMDWRGKYLVKVDRFFPSSKQCSVCGQINNDLQLSERTWTCSCGATHNRDVNAAINLKREGVRLLQDQGIIVTNNHATVGTTGSYASGDRVRPASAGSGQRRRKSSAFRQ